MELNHRQNLLIAGFLLLSLLLHLLLLLLPKSGLLRFAEPTPPVYVEIRPPLQRDRELDLPLRPPPPRPRETPAKRLGPQDQEVKRETAPSGKDAEDTPRSRPALRPRMQTTPLPAPPPAPVLPEPRRPVAADGDHPAADEQPAPRPAPELKDLTTLTPATMAKLESDWRKKYREGVAKGDTVWLDTEQDLLISFFKRLKEGIYRVWNYPARAKQHGEQGQCLLRIIVNRAGTVEDIALLVSSGSHDLDNEAIRAVYQGQPYGPLPSAYPHELLNIMAYFNYSLSRHFIYGERP